MVRAGLVMRAVLHPLWRGCSKKSSRHSKPLESNRAKPRMIMIFHSGIYLGYAIYTLAMGSIVTSNQGPTSMKKENYTLGEAQCATIHVCFYNVNSCLYAVLEQRLVLYIPPYFSITSPSMIEVSISFSVFI